MLEVKAVTAWLPAVAACRHASCIPHLLAITDSPCRTVSQNKLIPPKGTFGHGVLSPQQQQQKTIKLLNFMIQYRVTSG